MPDVVTTMPVTIGREARVREVHRFLPEGWETPPTTVHEALVIGKAIFLEDRARWVKGTVFKCQHPEEDPSTPYCDAWGVCAMGALAVAIVGLYQPENELYWQLNQYVPDNQAVDWLYEQGTRELHRATKELYDIKAVYQLNDHDDTTFEYVLNVFNRALENTSEMQDEAEEAPAT